VRKIDETVEQEIPPEVIRLSEERPRRRRGLWVSLSIVTVVAVISLFAFFGWTQLYSSKFEPNPPEIVAIEIPRGIGLAPTTLKMDLRDNGAGLDEVVVRAKQRGRSREILRQSLGGKKATRVAIDFPGDKSDLEEGSVELEVKAFDRSFWNNGATRSISLKVDFRRPRLEVLTTQHNARRGGSQLILYRAIDEDLAISGVKVGDQSFNGFPARGLDKEFEDPSLFAALFAVDMREGEAKNGEAPPLQLFAEDSVGNSVSSTFYYRVQDRSPRQVVVKVGEEFLRRTVAGIIEQNLARLEADARAGGKALLFSSQRGSGERLLEQFKLVNERLRELDEQAIQKLLVGPRFERQWDGPLSRPLGGAQLAFGDQANFEFEGKEIGSTLMSGYEIPASKGGADVYAAAEGVVTFSEGLGVYGRTLGVDHGLGLSTIYGSLDQAFVAKGDTVKRGQRIARAGTSGLARGPRLYFEVRVHGVPVAPEEWWEDHWFGDHLTSKINDVKRSLGMVVLRPIGG